jgi:hypothetical protein
MNLPLMVVTADTEGRLRRFAGTIPLPAGPIQCGPVLLCVGRPLGECPITAIGLLAEIHYSKQRLGTFSHVIPVHPICVRPPTTLSQYDVTGKTFAVEWDESWITIAFNEKQPFKTQDQVSPPHLAPGLPAESMVDSQAAVLDRPQ